MSEESDSDIDIIDGGFDDEDGNNFLDDITQV